MDSGKAIRELQDCIDLPFGACVSEETAQMSIQAIKIVDDIPRVLQNLKNMKAAWEDESFKDRRYAEAHIKSLRTAIEQVEQLLRGV